MSDKMATTTAPLCPHCQRPMQNGPNGNGPFCFWSEDCPSWTDAQKPMDDSKTTDPGDDECYDDDPRDWDEEDGDDFDCHLMPDGLCGAAGSEMCDFECPNRHSAQFVGSRAWCRVNGVKYAGG